MELNNNEEEDNTSVLAAERQTIIEGCKSQIRNPEKKLFFFGKIMISLSIIFILAINSYKNIFLPQTSPECITDSVLNAFNEPNSFLNNNSGIKYPLMILSALLLDIQMIFIVICFVFNTKSYRFLFALIMLFLARIIFQVIHFIIFFIFSLKKKMIFF